MDIRIILFFIVFFYAISLTTEGFDPKPVLDGISIEENLSVNDFLSGSTHKNSNQEDIDKIYDVFDEIDSRIKEINEALDIYEEDICKDGNCISCNLPSPTEQYEIDTENCGLFTPEIGNVISLNSTCQFKCKSGFTEIIGSNKPGFCTIDPSPINKFTGKLNPYPSIQCSQD